MSLRPNRGPGHVDETYFTKETRCCIAPLSLRFRLAPGCLTYALLGFDLLRLLATSCKSTMCLLRLRWQSHWPCPLGETATTGPLHHQIVQWLKIGVHRPQDAGCAHAFAWSRAVTEPWLLPDTASEEACGRHGEDIYTDHGFTGIDNVGRHDPPI